MDKAGRRIGRRLCGWGWEGGEKGAMSIRACMNDGSVALGESRYTQARGHNVRF